MNIRSGLLCAFLGVLFCNSGYASPLTIVQHLTRVKILESNMVSIRPGSVYENKTNFELLFDFPNPGFNYRFIDTGLGTADPIYPIYQKGHQGSWWQLLFAALGEGVSRHIDHFTSLPTPEGCHVDSVYMLRNIGEFGDLYAKEKAEGFKQIVIRLEYYTRLRPDAECGRHRANDPDPNFDPMRFLKRNLRVQKLADFPQAELARFEAHVAAIRHLSEEFGKNKWPRFDFNLLRNFNSLWYYQFGIPYAYGIRNEYRLGDLDEPFEAADLVLSADENLQSLFPLSELVEEHDYKRMVEFLKGKPILDYRLEWEPGRDILDVTQVSSKHIYTSGLYMEPIQTAEADVTNSENYRLVGLSLQPAVKQADYHFPDAIVPQIRLVYQLMDPRNPDRPFEQMFFHLNFDVVDRHADEDVQIEQHLHFLSRMQELREARTGATPISYSESLAEFVREFTSRRIQEFSFSSALTGMWIFGLMSRNHNDQHILFPQPIVRAGINVGYYSSINDNNLFRREIHQLADGHYRKDFLLKHMDDLRVSEYRDPKRMDVEAIRFDRMTCAQCHHMSARDGVHMSFNDHLDRRVQSPMRVTEFVYREADRQLKLLENRWDDLF